MAIAKGCADDQIQQFEARYKVSLPDDMRDYFATVNGMVEALCQDQDQNGFCYWPLKRVKTVIEVAKYLRNKSFVFRGAESFFVFSDYLSWCWGYAIRLSQNRSEGNDVILLCCRNPIKIANSFSEFIELYLVDDEKLYPPSDHGHT